MDVGGCKMEIGNLEVAWHLSATVCTYSEYEGIYIPLVVKYELSKHKRLLYIIVFYMLHDHCIPAATCN